MRNGDYSRMHMMHMTTKILYACCVGQMPHFNVFPPVPNPVSGMLTLRSLWKIDNAVEKFQVMWPHGRHVFLFHALVSCCAMNCFPIQETFSLCAQCWQDILWISFQYFLLLLCIFQVQKRVYCRYSWDLIKRWGRPAIIVILILFLCLF